MLLREERNSDFQRKENQVKMEMLLTILRNIISRVSTYTHDERKAFKGKVLRDVRRHYVTLTKTSPFVRTGTFGLSMLVNIVTRCYKCKKARVR